MTPGRNDRCPCGSGKKYKKCHYGRESQKPVNPFESGIAFRKALEHNTCYHPLAASGTCSGKAIRAHSVRRSADLSALAVDGHVNAIVADPTALIRSGGRLEAQLVGINKASTFTGFCNYHDTSTFAPLETRTFVADFEQCFLLFYRAWARETFTKEGSARTLSILRDTDKGRDKRAQREIQEHVALHEEGLALGLQDIRWYKQILDQALLARDFSVVSAAVVWFADALPFACSGAFYPYHSIGGTRIQEFAEDSIADAVVVTLLNEGGRGCAVLCWLEQKSGAATLFVDSVLRMPNLADALCRVVFTKVENVYSSPPWWNGLEAIQREELIDRVMEGVTPFSVEHPKALLPRGAPFLNIPLDRIERVGEQPGR
jgi:hypothetical protein